MSDDTGFLLLHPSDNIVVARRHLKQGASWSGNSVTVEARERVDLGHKMAISPIAQGEAIRKFGQPIGFATQPIDPGENVHTHNVGLGHLGHSYEYCTSLVTLPPPKEERTFQGIRRPDGRAATRNYVGIISTVNCSATSARYIADAFDEQLLEQYPNVDGVVALSHKGGCAFEYGGSDHRLLARTLAGFAEHPNIGAYLIVGLGCETAQASFLTDEHNLVELNLPGNDSRKPLVMNIQDQGGVAKTVERGIAMLKELLPEVNRVERVPIPVSELILATECGGSDGNSGVTANPAVGIASDLLVAAGGTSILAEVPEIYGGEHLLTRRAATREIADKLLERIQWWEDYAKKFGAQIDNNPSVGNKKGGLTTIFEKSLGAIAKGGSSPLRAVYEYAERVREKGFVIMDTPGYDPPSVTGMVAGGANLVVFTTGRGSCFGCKPVPTIKVATNSLMYHRMVDDMDLNAGRILDGEATVEQVGEELFEMLIAVASGEQTKSEQQGIGDEEFCPWTPGPVF
ncbi:D-galactarate dehydratase [Thalassoglobus neptunius]|uniref:D-galactarate dehydratase n=1 Tax=Thalassoglobus neptunius TaxID=1938619 RepID=A0A5C5X5Z1_9PLAN|nr:altronate dehydratase family protein [Thalassoglobus neptunius]TWT58527.1 D-galactarate dehydratase [Thalassoglobus neptunius]